MNKINYNARARKQSIINEIDTKLGYTCKEWALENWVNIQKYLNPKENENRTVETYLTNNRVKLHKKDIIKNNYFNLKNYKLKMKELEKTISIVHKYNKNIRYIRKKYQVGMDWLEVSRETKNNRIKEFLDALHDENSSTTVVISKYNSLNFNNRYAKLILLKSRLINSRKEITVKDLNNLYFINKTPKLYGEVVFKFYKFDLKTLYTSDEFRYIKFLDRYGWTKKMDFKFKTNINNKYTVYYNIEKYLFNNNQNDLINNNNTTTIRNYIKKHIKNINLLNFAGYKIDARILKNVPIDYELTYNNNKYTGHSIKGLLRNVLYKKLGNEMYNKMSSILLRKIKIQGGII